MVYFQTKKCRLGKFWRTLEWQMLKYFVAIWNILRTFGIFYDHLVHFVSIWYSFSGIDVIYLATLVARAFAKLKEITSDLMAQWHHIHLRNRRPSVRIPRWYKVFRTLRVAMLLFATKFTRCLRQSDINVYLK
jgi:hypothetical protein